MKNQAKRLTKAIAIALMGLAISSCGRTNGAANNVPQNTPVGANSFFNFPGGNIPITGGGCAPITGPIPFTAQGIYMDWANIIGGFTPMTSTPIGQVVVGGGAVGGGQYNGSGSDFSISMNVIPMNGFANMPYAGYPNQSMFGMPGWGTQNQFMWGTTGMYPFGFNGMNQGNQLVNATGFIQLSQLMIQNLVYLAQMGQLPIAGAGVNTGFQQGIFPGNMAFINPSQICVSALAINVGHYYSTIYGGYVYIYFNGTNVGLPIRI